MVGAFGVEVEGQCLNEVGLGGVAVESCGGG